MIWLHHRLLFQASLSLLLLFQFLQSARLLGDAVASFDKNCVRGIQANKERMLNCCARVVKRKFAPEPLGIMMVEKPDTLLTKWWNELHFNHKEMVKLKVGNLPSLLEIRHAPRRDLTCALLHFWDPSRNTFRFSDFEMTPTVEEYAGLLGLKLAETKVIAPRKTDKHSFCKGLKLIPGALCADPTCNLNMGWTTVDFLYERFGKDRGLHEHTREFYDNLTFEDWMLLRPKAFLIALLGVMVFPLMKKRIAIQISSVVETLFGKVPNPTIVPMVLASTFRALTMSRTGEEKYFTGCNILLEIWFVEHLLPRSTPAPGRPRLVDYMKDHKGRTDFIQLPETERQWKDFLSDLISDKILWQCPWFPFNTVVIGCVDRPFLALMGLLGVQPYAPARVLRQLGRVQDVPRVEDMTAFAFDFKTKEDYDRHSQFWRMWDNVRTERPETQVLDKAGGVVTSQYLVWYRNSPPLQARPPRAGEGLYDLAASFDLKVRLATQQLEEQGRRDRQRLKEVQEESQRRADADALALANLHDQVKVLSREKIQLAEKAHIETRRLEVTRERLEHYMTRHAAADEEAQRNLARVEELENEVHTAEQEHEELRGQIDYLRVTRRRAERVVKVARIVSQSASQRLARAVYFKNGASAEEIAEHAPWVARCLALDLEALQGAVDTAPSRYPDSDEDE